VPLKITRALEDGLPSLYSFWMPDAAELAQLNAGMPVALRVVGVTHPPLWIGVAVSK
jgi:hypothetical protein